MASKSVSQVPFTKGKDYLKRGRGAKIMEEEEEQVGAPTVPSAVTKCQFCYWSYHVIHVIDVIKCLLVTI
jgi:hypothetical protein